MGFANAFKHMRQREANAEEMERVWGNKRKQQRKENHMGLTTDPNDPRLGHGVDEKPIPQHDVYLVLSEEERAKGFVRPVRSAYQHVGSPGPKYPLRDLTEAEKVEFSTPYAKYEKYPESESPVVGRFWTQKDLDKVGKGCGTITTMGQTLSETYARDPHFYGATYCVHCSKHLKVGADGEFVWEGTDIRVGT